MEAGDPAVPTSDRVLSALAYVGPLVIVPLLMRRKARFVRYHTRQAIYVFVVFVVAFLLTLGLLYLFSDRLLDVAAAFNVLAVLFLLEIVAYVLGVVFLVVQASRARMPMVPLLGELSGEV